MKPGHFMVTANRRLIVTSLLLVAVCSYASGQTTSKTAGHTTADSGDSRQPSTENSNSSKDEKIPIILYLAGGGTLAVDEVTEDASGFWYKRGNISTFMDRAKVERIQRPAPPRTEATATFEGTGRWRIVDAAKVQEFFLTTFQRPLPLTAFGQSDLHNRWGWDHRNGIDVGLHPDSLEGRALIVFLQENSIPFLAFRHAIPGIATGPHIHIGNPSPRLVPR